MTQFAPTRDQTFRQARSTRGRSSIFGALMTAPLRWLGQAWIEHRDERLLQSLSDAQLRDLGIARSQIPHVVRDGLCR